MSKIYNIVFFICFASLLNAQSPVFDKFDYPASEPLDGKSGGAGFTGPWTFSKGAGITNIGLGGLDIIPLEVSTSNNHFKVGHTTTNGGARFYRTMSAPITDDGGLYYFSWAMDNDYESPTTNGAVAQFMLVRSNLYKATGPDGQLVRFGKQGSNIKLGVDGPRVGATRFINDTDSRDSHWSIAVLKMSGDAQRETMYWFINPDVKSLDTTKADLKFTVDLNDGFDALGFKVEGAGNNNMLIDELRFGKSLADVVPTDLVPYVKPNTIIAAENFNYTAIDSVSNTGKTENGFIGKWIDLNKKKSAAIIDKGMVNEINLTRTGTASMIVRTKATPNRYARYFTAPIAPSKESFWFSTTMASAGNSIGTEGALFFIDSTKANDGSQHVTIGKGGSDHFFTASGDGQSGNTTVTTKLFERASASWVVGYASFENGKWLFDIWVNPKNDETPSEDDALIKNKEYSTATFHGIGLKAEGGDGYNFTADDIIIGEIFSDIIPKGLSDMPVRPEGAKDKFDYAANTKLGGANGGRGFTGAFKILGGVDPSIQQGGISNFTYLKKTSSNRLQVDAASAMRAVRGLKGSYGDNGREYWLGWYFRAPKGGANVAKLILADSVAFNATGTSAGQLVQMGQLLNGGIGVLPGGAKLPNVASTEGHFIVANIVTNGNAINDDVFLWVNPDLSSPPARSSAVNAKANLATWNSLGFKVEYSGDSLVTPSWDEITLAGSFQDVIPTDLITIDPPVLPEIAYEGFSYAVGSKLNGLAEGNGWAGAWSSSGTDNGSITGNSILSDKSTAVGNKLTINQSSTDVVYERKFKAPFGAEDDQTVWTSQLIDIIKKDNDNAFNIALIDGSNKVKASFGGVKNSSKFGVVNEAGTQSLSASVDASGVKWIVTKTIISKNDPDKILVWVNPRAEQVPEESTADFSLTSNVVDGLAGIRITASGSQTTSVNIDEIRTGFEFREVSSKFFNEDVDLLAYEPFNYDANANLIGLGGQNGFFNTPWASRGTLKENIAKVGSGSLVLNGYKSVANKARLEYSVPDAQIRMERQLYTPIKNDGKTYWLSFLQKTDPTEAKDNIGNVTLRSKLITAQDGQTLSFGRIIGTGKLGLITPQNNLATVIDNIEDSGLNWVVVKIKTTGTTTLDTVYMWVNPDVSKEPDTAKAQVVRATAAIKQPLDFLRIRNEGTGANQVPYNTEFDEIKIATSWNSAKLTVNTIEYNREKLFGVKAYPNPAGEAITLEYNLSAGGDVAIDLINIQGAKSKRLVNSSQTEGNQKLSIDLSTIENGIYLIKITQGQKSEVNKIIILK